MDARWFANHVAYTISKYGMSMCVLGMAEEYRQAGIAVNGLWPQTLIATAAVRNLLGGEEMVRRSRKPAILADAAYFILRRESRTCTGNLFIDEEVMRAEGITDLGSYSVEPGASLIKDLFL